MLGVRAGAAPRMEQGIRIYGVGNDPGATIHRIQTVADRARACLTNRSFGTYVETAEKQISGQVETPERLGREVTRARFLPL